MPIEIRELVIRATVNPAGGGKGSCGDAPADRNPAGTGNDASAAAGEELVQACVREVMRLLEQKTER